MATYYVCEARPVTGGYYELTSDPAMVDNPEPVIDQFYRITGREEPYLGWLLEVPEATAVRRVRAHRCTKPALCLKSLQKIDTALRRAPGRFPGFAWVTIEEAGQPPRPVSSSLSVTIDGTPSCIAAGWDRAHVRQSSPPYRPRRLADSARVHCVLNERPVIVGFEPHPLHDDFSHCFATAMTLIRGADANGSLVYVCGVP